MQALDFFSGIFNLPIGDEMIESALFRRNLSTTDYIDYDDTETIELVTADILVMLSRVSASYEQKTSSDAFSMTMGGTIIPLTDRQSIRREADAIYRKYKEYDKCRVLNAINI